MQADQSEGSSISLDTRWVVFWVRKGHIFLMLYCMYLQELVVRRDGWSEYSWSCSVTPRFLATTEILRRGCGWEMHSWKEEKLSVVQMELHVHRDMGQTCRDVQCYLGFRL